MIVGECFNTKIYSLSTEQQMKITLHKGCSDRLVEKLGEIIPSINVEHHMFLESESVVNLIDAESILPTSGKTKEHLEQYIGETPVFNFISEFLSRELLENEQYDPSDKLIKLVELEAYKDSKGVAKRLVDELESLPWNYALTIALKNDFGKLFASNLKSFDFGESIRLIVPNSTFAADFPLQSGVTERDKRVSRNLGEPPGFSLTGLPSEPKPLEWNPSATYLQIKVEGFIGVYGSSSTQENAINILKAFCGIAIALRLFKVNHQYRATSTKTSLFVHRLKDQKWQIEGSVELDSNVSDAFNDIALHELYEKAESVEDRIAWILASLNRIKKAFANQERARKLLLGGQWLFDSFSGRNELLSFVQATVVLEILLGEKAASDAIGLGELLRNRCAYLIGNSQKERDSVLKDFKEIYDVRSKIVHSGKSLLNIYESNLFSKLQWMCRRVIQKEIELLDKNN